MKQFADRSGQDGASPPDEVLLEARSCSKTYAAEEKRPAGQQSVQLEIRTHILASNFTNRALSSHT